MSIHWSLLFFAQTIAHSAIIDGKEVRKKTDFKFK